MIVACTACGAKYRYEESRFEGKPSKRIRCTKCEAIFEVHNPEFVLRPELRPEPPVANPAPVIPADATHMRRGVPHVSRPAGGAGNGPRDTTKENALSRHKSSPLSQNLRLPAGKKLSLAVISGADSGKNFPIDKPRVVIGRTGSDVALSDAEISRAHAALEVEDDDVTLVDLGSTNGTYVNGSRVEKAPLENYGEFEVGGTTLMLIVTGEPI